MIMIPFQNVSLIIILVVILLITLETQGSKTDETKEATMLPAEHNHHYHRTEDMGRLSFHHFKSTLSTQNEAKLIAEGSSTIDDHHSLPDTAQTFCVTASEQINGRGTSGRLWMGSRGNTYVTIGITMKRWMTNSNRGYLPITLLPLKIGSLVASRIRSFLSECSSTANCNDDDINIGDRNKGVDGTTCDFSDGKSGRVTVKWPNDVLVDREKISGILIESTTNEWLLIGIGINVAHAPPISTTGSNNGRTSTCLQNHCPQNFLSPSINNKDDDKDNNDIDNNKDDDATIQATSIAIARRLGEDLARDVHAWFQQWMDNEQQPTTSSSLAESIVEEWRELVDPEMELILRDVPTLEEKRYVKMVDVLPDGRIKVIGTKDGLEQILVSDYFL